MLDFAKIEKIRKLEDPYLHELFKSVLLYDAEEAKKILARRIGGKLLKEWVLEDTYQEVKARKNWNRKEKTIADVVWLVVHPEHRGYRKIIHEVKTWKWKFDCYP